MKKAPQRLLMFMYFTGIFDAAVRQIFLSYSDTIKILYSVFCSHSFRITYYTPSASLLES